MSTANGCYVVRVTGGALTASLPRRTQAERRASARRRLLEAALGCLVEEGYARFTTLAVCRRAGMSQGGLFRHFPTKEDLLVATMDRLVEEHLEEWEERFFALAPADRTPEAGLRLLSTVTTDERLRAVFDLAAAARTDAGLRAQVAPLLGNFLERMHAVAHQVLGDALPLHDELFTAAIDLALSAMLGLALLEIAEGDLARRDRVVGLLEADRGRRALL
jgi:AcrR family transcriptional regulator